MAENAYSSFVGLGLACTEQIIISKILCVGNKNISSVGYCQKLVQFMWWAAQPGDATLEYSVALTLIADPKPGVARWRDAATEEALDLLLK
jgi:hypothetical protein